MTPEDGKILIIDDDKDLQTVLALGLRASGYEVLSATDKQSAMSMVDRLAELGVRAALIDGNLSPHSQNGTDGKTINKAIKELWGEAVWTAGISVSDPIPGADVEQLALGIGPIVSAIESI